MKTWTALTLCLWSLAGPVTAQTLGEAAATEAARRGTVVTPPTKVITNKDLPETAPVERAPTPAAGETPVATAGPDASSAGFSFDSIRTKCATEWVDDFRMRVFCETQQKTALAAILARRPLMGSTPDLQAIRVKCLRDWSTKVGERNGDALFQVDFRMTNFCEEQQMKALGVLSR